MPEQIETPITFDVRVTLNVPLYQGDHGEWDWRAPPIAEQLLEESVYFSCDGDTPEKMWELALEVHDVTPVAYGTDPYPQLDASDHATAYGACPSEIPEDADLPEEHPHSS